jgi:hypothetical protein
MQKESWHCSSIPGVAKKTMLLKQHEEPAENLLTLAALPAGKALKILCAHQQSKKTL